MIARSTPIEYAARATLRRAVVLVVLALLAIPAMVAPASATEVKLRSCSQYAIDEASTSNGWTVQAGGPIGDYPMWKAVRDCPRGLGLDTSAPAENGTWAQLAFDTLYLPVSSVSMTLEGETDPDLAYAIVTCQYGICRALMPLAQRTATDPPQLLSVPLPGWPETTVALKATCMVANCGGSEMLRIRDIEFNVLDTRAPVVDVWSIAAFESPSAAAWRQPDQVSVGFGAYDAWHSTGSGIGMGLLWALLDDQPSTYLEERRCGFSLETYVFLTYSSSCPGNLGMVYSPLSAQALSDGLHKFTLNAEDALGNRSAPQTVYFNIDGTPPDAPESPVVQGLNQNGWTTDSAVRITSWVNGAEVHRTSTQSGIAGATYDFKPLSGQQPDPAPVPFGPGGPNLNFGGWWTIPSEGRWMLSVRLSDAVGYQSDSMKIPVGRDTDAPDTPQLDANPWLNREALIEGRGQTWSQVVAARVESGICGYAVSINSTADSDPVAVITHPGAISSVPIPVSTPAGVNYVHARAISCSGVASSTATTPLRIDDDAPQIELSGVPVTGWAREPLTADLTANDSLSGVESIEYQDGNTAKIVTAGSTATIAFAEGRHKFRFRARDRAGNSSAELPRDVDIDATPPSGGFLGRDPQQPSRISARLDDALSGVDTAQIQYRRIDVVGDVWHGLPTASSNDPVKPTRLLLRADLPDDQLADGSYALRVAAADRAGNTTSIDSEEATGDPARIVLPMRERWSVTAGIAVAGKSCRKSKRAGRGNRKRKAPRARSCRSRSSAAVPDSKPSRLLRYGTHASLTGVLDDSAGAPRAGVELKIYAAVEDHAPELVGTAVTDTAGRYSFPIADGPNRRFTVLYAGSPATLAAKAIADLRVRATATLSVNHRTTRVGSSVVFTGRLLSGGTNMPRTGKIIQFQFLGASGWQSGVATARADRAGRFRAGYTFTSPRAKPVRIKFRALIIAEGAWPFAENASPTVTVTVKP